MTSASPSHNPQPTPLLEKGSQLGSNFTGGESSQTIGSQDDWTKEVVPHLPAQVEEQAKKLKALERERSISSATDLLGGLLAYVYTAHSFQQLSMWSFFIGLANVSANDWRKRLRKASDWLDWLLQEVLAMAVLVSPWLVRTGLRGILLIDGTHLEVFGSPRDCHAGPYGL